ncbi:lipid II flippase MurJ [Herbaspirillum sp.]|uniref:lipid II flippase MurJ n=1 Tax=Herbaspirillum sp. TaxID=1890675 RepID=UPI001B0C215C|nr:lipid II flippase MurJ [Herbaspirillum sp.]MBO9536946.1 hypothetical protein [Herbaspirillum sp.]
MNSVRADGLPSQDKKISLFLVWIIFFSYSTCLAILFQKLILPAIPSLHGGMGLLIGDAEAFHHDALLLAQRISTEGWASWSAWPDQYNTGNVAILGALYAVFGDDPLLMLPLNAAMHALSGVLIIACGWRLGARKGAQIASVVVGTLFVVFPSALNWYAQLHKDNYSNLAYLLIFHAVLRVVQGSGRKEWTASFIQSMIGACLLAFVRPQYISILLLLIGVAAFVVVVSYGVFRLENWRRLGVIRIVMLFVILASIAMLGRVINANAKFDAKVENLEVYQDSLARKDRVVNAWQETSWLPRMIDNRLKSIAELRAGMLFYGEKARAGSTVDPDYRMTKAVDVLAYAPKALLNAVFAPFPSTWVDARSPTRIVGVFEIAVWFLLMPGLLLYVWRRSTVAGIAILAAVLAVLGLLGLVNTNLGTLHRIRYPFLFMLMLLGSIGWSDAVGKWIGKRRTFRNRSAPEAKPVVAQPLESTQPAAEKNERSQLVRMGIWVLGISLIGLAGLFLRDLVMARIFGLGAVLDAVQIGSVLPTFFAALFFVPLTNAITPELIRRQGMDRLVAQEWIRDILGWSLVGALLVIGFCLFLWEEQGRSGFHPDGANAVFGMSLAILALSGWVTIGNAVLNVNGMQRMAAVGQMLVPWPPILLLLFMGDAGGAMVVATGMVVGQLLNLLFVMRKVKAAGFVLWPRFGHRPVVSRDTVWGYLSITATSFLFGAAVPLGTWLAMQLGTGHAGAFALGYKMLSLTYAVVSALTTAVVVPYFSRHIVAGDMWRAKHGLAKLLYMSLLVSVPAAALLFGFANQFVSLLFGGGRFSADDAYTVAKVVQFASLQLPFMISNLLIVRFAEVSSQASRALVITVLAQVVTLFLAIYGFGGLGVAGVALAGSAGVIASTVCFLFLLIKDDVLGWLDAGLNLIGWWLFLTLCMCLYFSSGAGAVIVCVIFVLVAVTELLPAWRRAPKDGQELLESM